MMLFYNLYKFIMEIISSCNQVGGRKVWSFLMKIYKVENTALIVQLKTLRILHVFTHFFRLQICQFVSFFFNIYNMFNLTYF